MTLETALNAEIDEHLGYDKHEISATKNSLNGYSTKTLQTEDGQFELKIPSDRNNDFESELVKKKQRRFISMSDKILFLYAQGMTTREVVTTLKDLYDTEISATLVSRVTDAVIDQVVEWQARPLDPVYPIVYLDCIVLKIRQNKQVINKAVVFTTAAATMRGDLAAPDDDNTLRRRLKHYARPALLIIDALLLSCGYPPTATVMLICCLKLSIGDMSKTQPSSPPTDPSVNGMKSFPMHPAWSP